MRRQWPRGVYSEGSGSVAADEPSEGGIGSYYMAESFIHDERLWSMRFTMQPSLARVGADGLCADWWPSAETLELLYPNLWLAWRIMDINPSN